MIAHQNVIAQCLQIQQLTPPDLHKILAVLPAFHSKPPQIDLQVSKKLTNTQSPA